MNRNHKNLTPTRLIFTLVLATLWGLQAPALQPDKALESLLASNAIDKDRTAVYIWDLDADYQVASYCPTKPLTPASVMKCVTTASLQSCLSYTSKLSTGVFLEGEELDSIFEGVITIVGSGDPSVGDGRHSGQPDLPSQIAAALKERGIGSFRGNIKIDNSLFKGSPVPSSWEAADLDQYYGTGSYAFNYQGNASGKKAVKDPAAVFRRKLADAMASRGIEYMESDYYPKVKRKIKLLSHLSPRIDDLMASCMFRSDNLYAEAFLRLFGVLRGTDGSFAESAKKVLQHWDSKHFPVEQIEIIDGSGLSRQNRLTAEFLGSVLREMASDPTYVSFFPLAGEEGTVRSFMKDSPLAGYLALKTGSMNGIQSYAGYLLNEDYEPTHVIVVMTNGLKNRGTFRSDLAKFFMALFSDRI